MTIVQRPSPNYNARRLPVSMLVLHYTGMETGAAAVDRLCDPAAQVSAHYVVDEEGGVLQLVAEAARAWHAGAGGWRGCTDVNSASIGIEIVNGGHEFGLPDYPAQQIDAVIGLSRAVLDRHAIAPVNVIGHSDMAPGRKQDPGEKFPWARLAEAGVGLWPSALRPGPVDPAAAHAALGAIGYPTADADFGALVAAFQRRYRPDRIDGILDPETAGLVRAVRVLAQGDG